MDPSVIPFWIFFVSFFFSSFELPSFCWPPTRLLSPLLIPL
jgi:hypothetical protein